MKIKSLFLLSGSFSLKTVVVDEEKFIFKCGHKASPIVEEYYDDFNDLSVLMNRTVKAKYFPCFGVLHVCVFYKQTVGADKF